MEVAISNLLIKNKERVKLQEIHINGSLNFDYYVNRIYKKQIKNFMLTLEFANIWTLGSGEPSWKLLLHRNLPMVF